MKNQRTNYLLVGLIWLTATAAWAQSPVANRISSGVDLGAGFKVDNINPSVQYYQVLHLVPNRLFSIGWTTKLSTFYGKKLDFITAPAGLSRGKTGFDAIGAAYVPANLDTLSFGTMTVTSLNFGIRVQGKLGPVELGASADLLGISLGASRTAIYQSSTGKFVAGVTAAKTDSLVSFTGVNASQSARPGIANLRLLGDNNIGTLGTEVFARILINQRVGIKLGYQWIITEMTAAKRDVVAGNNRFRYTTSMPYVALTFPLF